MSTRVALAGAALLSALMSAAAPAADGTGNYAIYGAGGRSCNQFMRADGDDARAPFRHYLMGYLTAYNTLRDDNYSALGAMSLDEAMGWLGDYCDTNRLDSYERAITQLVSDRFEDRQRDARRSSAWGGAPRAPAGKP